MASDETPRKETLGKEATGPESSGKPERRYWGGPRPIGALLPAITRPAFRSRSAAGAQVMADWPVIVGPALAQVSVPRQLNRGTLTLACSGPVALELQHLAGQLAERINAHYGRTVVEGFRFVQAAVPTTGPVRSRRAKPVPPVEVPGFKEGALRDALAALGGAVAQASKARAPRRREPQDP